MSRVFDTYPQARCAYAQFKAVLFGHGTVPDSIETYFEKLADVVQTCLCTRTADEQDEILTLAILRKQIPTFVVRERSDHQQKDFSGVIAALSRDYAPTIADAMHLLLSKGEDALADAYPHFSVIEQLEEAAALAALSPADAKDRPQNWADIAAFAQEELTYYQETYGSNSEESRLAALCLSRAQALHDLCTPVSLSTRKAPRPPGRS